MKQLAIAGFMAVLLIARPVQAQHQPYAGEQGREIKALSADEVKQYLSGAGMGYAKAAEMNHFPGPTHVLDKLGLTAEQRADVKRLMEAHKVEARAMLTVEQVARYDELRGYAKPAAAEDAHQH